MHKDSEQFVKDMDEPKAPKYLLENIMRRIHMEKHISILKRRIAVFSLCFAAVAIVSVPVFRMIEKDFADSGFFEFLSLIFPHFSIVAAYWQSYLFALFESLPVMSVVAFLACILVLLGSLKLIVRDTRIIRASRSMA